MAGLVLSIIWLLHLLSSLDGQYMLDVLNHVVCAVDKLIHSRVSFIFIALADFIRRTVVRRIINAN